MAARDGKHPNVSDPEIAGQPRCLVCKRRIRATNLRAEMMCLRIDGSEVWLCGPRCATAYNDDDKGVYCVSKVGGSGVRGSGPVGVRRRGLERSDGLELAAESTGDGDSGADNDAA